MQSFDLKPKEIYTISQLNREAKLLLEQKFTSIWAEGEISNFAAPQSGHWYFCIKDAQSQVRCAMFRTQIRKLDFIPKDGMHVIVKTKVSLYENRGEFQLIIESMEEQGEGKLKKAFEQLKKKLLSEGLFESTSKKPLPLFPKQIGVITSNTGAAIRDIINVLNRRFPTIPVIIYPTLVQGQMAAPAIVKMIETANKRADCEVIILARGGGSLEDLWPFNEEIVARAIFASNLPIITGIGHEIDFTIADFVADKRAPTPSAAAELVTPDVKEVILSIKQCENILINAMLKKLKNNKQMINWHQKHLQQHHPKRILQEKMQRVDFFEMRIKQISLQYFLNLKHRLNEFIHQITVHTPLAQIKYKQNSLILLEEKLKQLTLQIILHNKNKLAFLAGKLNALSPLNTLKRGFAIATDGTGKIVDSAKKIRIGDEISLKLHEGKILTKVIKI